MSTTVHALMQLFGSPVAVRALAPTLRLSESPQAVPSALRDDGIIRAERAWLLRDGFAQALEAAPRETCQALVSAAEALHERGLPATFMYAFDEPWALGNQLCDIFSAVVGRKYRLIEDVWAWRIAPGTGRGWPAHRGVAEERLDRDAPEILNVWLALSDATADRACMHAVPLDDDPGYPNALALTTAPLSAVRALPIRAGDALFWNANVLHWGGPCAARASGPRVSCSFTLCRADAAERFPEIAPLPALDGFGLTARMDLLARMILLYGAEDRGDVHGPVREWARLTCALVSRCGG